MKRLTDYHVGENGAYMKCSGNCPGGLCENCKEFEKIIDRLAAYEDTGLGPEEILTGKELVEVACAMNLLKEYQAIGPIDHLRELAQAEKDGRLMVLPLKIGDTLFDTTMGDIKELTVKSIPMMLFPHGLRISLNATNYRGAFLPIEKWQIGKTMFLTREEAEAALKKRGEEDNEAERKTGRYRPKD